MRPSHATLLARAPTALPTSSVCITSGHHARHTLHSAPFDASLRALCRTSWSKPSWPTTFCGRGHTSSTSASCRRSTASCTTTACRCAFLLKPQKVPSAILHGWTLAGYTLKSLPATAASSSRASAPYMLCISPETFDRRFNAHLGSAGGVERVPVDAVA